MATFVNIETAKALKEIGYPQSPMQTEHGYALGKFVATSVYREDEYSWFKEGDFLCFDDIENFKGDVNYCVAPTYYEVWLWLWREKGIPISLLCDECELLEKKWYPNSEKLVGVIGSFTDEVFFSDPEEALIASIDWIFKNNLVK